MRCFVRGVGAGSSNEGAAELAFDGESGDAAGVDAGGAVLAESTDQPSARPAMRPIVSSLRERLVDDGTVVRTRSFAASLDRPSGRLAVRAASAVATFACAADRSFRTVPGAGVVREGADAGGSREGADVEVPREPDTGAGGGVLGASTDQPSARPAIRPNVSSLRGADEDRTSSMGFAPDSRAVMGFGVARGALPAVGVRVRALASAPAVGVRIRPLGSLAAPLGDRTRPLGSPTEPSGARALESAPAGVRTRPLDSLAAPVGVRVRPLASPVAVRAGSLDAGGDGRVVGAIREGAGVAAGVAAAGGSSLGDSTDQPDARSAMRLLVSSPSRRRVRSSSGTGRP
ncbi:MAG: hypothetical protein HOV81_15905 [Kofleriaceae bacterium]|nr:hypothetical protein [Kofleriaceae bacterium]